MGIASKAKALGFRQHLLDEICNEKRLVELPAATGSHGIVGCLFRDAIYQLAKVLKRSLLLLVLDQIRLSRSPQTDCQQSTCVVSRKGTKLFLVSCRSLQMLYALPLPIRNVDRRMARVFAPRVAALL